MNFGVNKALDRWTWMSGRDKLRLIGPNAPARQPFSLHHRHLPAHEGDVFITPPAGKRSASWTAFHRVTARGLARTFQNIRLFPDMTVWKTSWGTPLPTKAGVLGPFSGTGSPKEEKAVVTRATHPRADRLADLANALAAISLRGPATLGDRPRLATEPFLTPGRAGGGMKSPGDGSPGELILRIKERANFHPHDRARHEDVMSTRRIFV